MEVEISEVHGDPRIFENPIEASIDLAELTKRRLPLLRKRSRYLYIFGLLWTMAMMLLTVHTGLVLWGNWNSTAPLDFWELIITVALILVLLPSSGLGITILLLAFQERKFLGYLGQTSFAMTALEQRPRRNGRSKGKRKKREKGKPTGSSLVNILGSAIWVGDLVPVVGRMTTVGRAIMAIILLGLGLLVFVTVLALTISLFILVQVVIMIVVFALFVGPAVLLFHWITKDHDFYWYYSRRHRALADVAMIGIPPVPKGDTPMDRFDTFLTTHPLIQEMVEGPKGGIERGAGRKGYRFSRYYHGTLFNVRSGILVREFKEIPDADGFDALLEEATAFGKRKHVFVTRVVALITAEIDDFDDEVYDHVIAIGKKTMPGECALQLAMEVEGLYSLVPYVGV